MHFKHIGIRGRPVISDTDIRYLTSNIRIGFKKLISVGLQLEF